MVTSFGKHSIIDVWEGTEYAFENISDNKSMQNILKIRHSEK